MTTQDLIDLIASTYDGSNEACVQVVTPRFSSLGRWEAWLVTLEPVSVPTETVAPTKVETICLAMGVGIDLDDALRSLARMRGLDHELSQADALAAAQAAAAEEASG